MGIVKIALLLVVCACTMAPYLFIDRRGSEDLAAWFKTLDMHHQWVVWTVARITSYPFMETLHAAVAQKLSVTGCFLLCLLGEWTGTALQFYLFDTALAPLVSLRKQPRLAFVANALETSPVAFVSLMRMSLMTSIAPYLVAFGVPCIGSSWLLVEATAGTFFGESAEFLMTLTAIKWPGSQQFISQVLIPSIRWTCTLFLAYWLWQEHRACESSSKETEPSDAATRAASKPRLLRFSEGPPMSPHARPETQAAAATPRKRARARAASKEPVTPTDAHETTKWGSGKPASASRSRTPTGKGRATTGRSVTPSRKKSPKKSDIALSTVQHRLETEMTEAIYDMPQSTPRRSSRLSTRK